MGFSKKDKQEIANALRGGQTNITTSSGSTGNSGGATQSPSQGGSSSSGGLSSNDKKYIAQQLAQGKTDITLPGYQPPKLEDFANANPLSATVQSLTNQRDAIAQSPDYKMGDPRAKKGYGELQRQIDNINAYDALTAGIESMRNNPVYSTDPVLARDLADMEARRAAIPTPQEKKQKIGQYGAGNVNLYNRNTGLRDENGNLMTVRSMSFNEDGKEILVPTVIKKDGKWQAVSDEEAIDHYHKTGEYLGKFDTVDEANAYAQKLHEEQDKLYGDIKQPEVKRPTRASDLLADVVTERSNPTPDVTAEEVSPYRKELDDLTAQRDSLDKQMSDVETAIGRVVDPTQRQQLNALLDTLLTQRDDLEDRIATAENNLKAEPDQWEIAAAERKEKKSQYDALGSQINEFETALGMAYTPEEQDAIRRQMAPLVEQRENLRQELNIPTTGERIGNMLEAAGLGVLAGNVDTQRSLYELGRGQRTRQTEAEIADLERELAKAQQQRAEYVEAYGEDSEYVKSTDEWINRYQSELDAYRKVVSAQEGATGETAAIADHFSEVASAATDKAKTDLNGVETFLVDAGINGVQMLTDAAFNLATGTPGSLIPLITRSYGGGTQAARQAGADINQQVLYGAATAAVESFTEKMFDGLAGLYGKGYADDMTELILDKVAKESSPEVRAALSMFLSGAGEATEEMVSGRLEPWLNAIYDNGAKIQETYGSLENYLQSWADTGYSMLVGFAMGWSGSVVAEAQNKTSGTAEAPTETRAESPAETKAETPTETPAPAPAPTVEPTVTDTLVDVLQNSRNAETGQVTRKGIDTILADQALIDLFNENSDAKIDGKNNANNRAATRDNADAVVAALTGTEVAENAPAGAAKPTVANNAPVENNAENSQQAETEQPVAEATHKERQNEIIQQTHPKNPDSQQAWIESADDILTYEEAVAENGDGGITPDFTAEMAEEALQSGYITVYSSHDIRDGTFVTPSKMLAQDYAGSKDVKSMRVKLSDVAWLDAEQGQYAHVPENETVQPTVDLNAWQANNIENEANGVRRERGESRNIRTDDARATELREFKEQNRDMYRTLKNEKVFDRAYDIFDEQGTEGAAATLESAIRDAQEGKKLPIEMVVLHKLVCDDLARNGQVERANRISSDIAAELTYAGRLGQANIILRDSSPTARAEAFRKTLTKLIGENNANVDEAAVKDLINRYRAAETDEARDAILDEATTAIAESSPTTFREALTAIRYLNMLGNFKTQFRNVLGNTGMLAMSRVKNRVLAVEQMATNAISNILSGKNAVEQTNTLTTNSDLYKEALEYYKEDRDATLGEGKYSDVAVKNKAINDKKTIFKWNWKNEGDSVLQKIADAPLRVLEKYRKLTNYAMDKGDAIFTKVTYAQSLADYAKAQGYNSLSEIDADTLQKMRDYAIKQAQEATFRDTNAISNFASTFDQNWGRAGKTIAQGVIPFRKTPANVGVRMWEYSPLGLVDALVDSARAVKGKTDANAILDDVAKSLSGSALTVLGFMMAKAGLARGKNDDKELEEYERNVQGLSDYSITLPWGSVSMDWFAPESAAFFVGVAAAEAFEDGKQADDFLTLLGSTSDIALNMSFLSGLQNSLDSLSSFNGNMKALPTFLLNSLISFGGQIATNSLLGQAEQASERYRQTSYSDKEGILPTGLQYTASKLTSKMPGYDYNQADYIDAWGRKVDNGENVAGRVAETFLSPAYINSDRSTEIDDELVRLHEATKDAVKGSVLPTVASRSTKVGDETLAPEEYELYQTRAGQTAYKLVSDFINGDGYADMTDEERAKVINDLYGFARDTAKNSVLLSRGEQTEKSEYDKARAIKDAGGMSWAEYYQTKEGRDMDGNGSAGAEETAQYLFENFPEDKAKKIFDTYYPDSSKSYEDYASHSQEIKDADMTKQEYDALIETVSEAKAGKEDWDSKGDNAVINAVMEAVDRGLSEDGAALIISEKTSKNYKNPFSALIEGGDSLTEAMDYLAQIDQPGKDGNKNMAIEQAELIAYFKEHPEEEAKIALVWDAMGYTGKKTIDWETFAKNGYKTR